MTYLGSPWAWYTLTRDEQIDLMAYHREITRKRKPAPPADPVERRSAFEERLRAYREEHRSG